MKKKYYPPQMASVRLDQHALMVSVSNETKAVPGVDEEAAKGGRPWTDNKEELPPPNYNVWD